MGLFGKKVVAGDGYDHHLKGGATLFDPDRIAKRGDRFLRRHAKNMEPHELARVKKAQENLKKYGL